jgi:peptide/nickel transport system ATP-binding protein
LTELSNQTVQSEPVLKIRNLRVNFYTYAGIVKAIDGLDLSLAPHEFLGLVGESGCGKSVTALAIAGLLPENVEIESGEILLQDKDLLRIGKKQLRLVRLSDIAFVFQDPMTYLNPVMSIGTQLTEAFTGNVKLFRDELINFRLEQIEDSLTSQSDTAASEDLRREREKLLDLKNNPQKKLKKSDAKRLAKLRAMGYLKFVNLPDPERVMKMYPFELSGGMRQRAMIAMALVRRPKVLLADEITTALDVTVQAQVLELIKELRNVIGTSVILITHDLGIVAQTCDRVAIMYAGNIVETASVKEIFKNPLHPYTKGLFAAIPRLRSQKGELVSITGSVPDLIFPPNGCRFHPRCPMAFEKCPKSKPPLIEAKPGHFVACLLYGG